MLRLSEVLKSTLGQKYLTALTGAGLVIFIIFHFISNLFLFVPNPLTYNSLSNSLVDLGGWLVIAEMTLLILVVTHILVVLHLKFISKHARQHPYEYKTSKRGPSKLGFSSTKLLLSGLVILIFLVVHILQFKYGPNISDGYSVQVEGKDIRDLHRLVTETFRKGYWAAFYAVSMVFLAFHLRHGIWSLFQSLGVTNRRTSSPIYHVGTVLAWIIGAGFALMPIFFVLGGGG